MNRKLQKWMQSKLLPKVKVKICPLKKLGLILTAV